ncbi:MAG TPA: hypothetical protein VFV93_07180 [Thermomicrobiales bacterium]|nr:hypothetical protein [Thermomicrobiales bacterium]
MARTRSVVIISLAATLAVVTAILVAARMSSSSWGALMRLFRDDNDHPHWELLAQ